MNKFLALAILSATVALGAASAEAASYKPAASHQTVMEGRNATETFAARNGAAAIRDQAEANARSAS